MSCTHLDTIQDVSPSGQGCKECLEMGDRWVHLRLCLTCGHVGCRDSSKNKHATYITPSVCAGISPIPCFSEECGPAVDPAVGGGQTFPIYNAGEPDMPLMTDLTAIGFPNEDAWADQDFCGGLGGVLCSGSILSKLTANPFE